MVSSRVIYCAGCGVSHAFSQDLNYMIGVIPLPKGWMGYMSGGTTKLNFCPKPECQRQLDILCPPAKV